MTTVRALLLTAVLPLLGESGNALPPQLRDLLDIETTDISKICGTYRSYPYVGVRCLYPHSPSMGILWYQPSQALNNKGQSLHSLLRHEANYDDRLERFGWKQHDGASYGNQEIIDPMNHVNMTVQWVYLKEQSSQHARWVLRVSGTRQRESYDQPSSNDLSLLWYVGSPGNLTATYNPIHGIISGEDFETCIVLSNTTRSPAYRDPRTCSSQLYNSTYFAAFQVPESVYFNPKPAIVQELRNPTSPLPPHLFDPSSLYRSATVSQGNQIVQQLFVRLPFQVDIHFHLRAQPINMDIPLSERCRTNWDDTTVALRKAEAAFQRRFADTFFQTKNGQAHNISIERVTEIAWSESEVRTAQFALSNMLSSITYMQGASQIYENETGLVQEGRTTTGLTLVPDRPDHAQGYLWDDGFHQQLVHIWDMDWTMNILKSWFRKTDAEGWIPRQMILGDETRWSAKPSSWPQFPGSANPPTHHWILQTLIEYEHNSGKSSTLGFREFLKDIWDALTRNLAWYFRSQASALPGLFRWEGRTNEYCLPSGMDDYPRAPILTTNESHLDLHCWMIVSCGAVSNVASWLGKHRETVYYQQMRERLTQSMLHHFWNDEAGVFDDFYITNNNEKTFVGHFGYINFFPIFLDVLPTNSSFFERTMEALMERENGMWSKYGLRSLSTKDPYYMKGDAYWTGLLWVNMNYLALSTLFKYVHNPQAYPMAVNLRSRINVAYQELRHGLIRLVVDEFIETGFIWEVYDPSTGKGHDNHPFTGWSALIVNIIAEIY